MITSPPTLMDSELTACSQSMILDELGDTTTNVSMETNANSMELVEDSESKTPYKKKLRSSKEFNMEKTHQDEEPFEIVEKDDFPMITMVYNEERNTHSLSTLNENQEDSEEEDKEDES